MHRASFQSPACRFVAQEPEARWTGSGERGQKKGGRKNGYHRAPSKDARAQRRTRKRSGRHESTNDNTAEQAARYWPTARW